MREIINLNAKWRFVEKNVSLEEARAHEGEIVNIPHTWNALDGQDGGGDYVRTKYWYFRSFEAPKLSVGQKLWLEFNAVNSSATVYLNNEQIGVHHGGYSRFRIEITDCVKEGTNEIAVLVDNEPNETVYPQTADFTFYGGIYRDVNLVKTEAIHFEMDASGSKGIKIDSQLSDNKAILTVHAWRSLPEDTRVEVFDAEGNLVAEGKGNSAIKIKNVHRWNGRKDPYLYKIVASAYDGDIKVDEIVEHYGFREFYIDPRKGFFLNGVPYPLRGVAKHQDRLGVGNAITREDMEEDIKLIAEVGANTIRLAHYQHDDYTYELCDKYGFLIWSEIPYISRHMPAATENAVSQMRELIAQTYNRCSIFCRGISNEITMKSSTGKTKVHKMLNELIHGLDPTRPTCMANFAMMLAFNPFCHIADATAMNFYHGWYTPWTWLNGFRLSFFHFFFPGKPLGFSEYGAEGMPNLHTEHPKRGDNSEEYQLICHYKVYKSLEKRKYLWATHLWNMFDFAADARNVGGDPGKNHKGLVTFDRKTKKDAFYLYKAFWSDEPFVHICGKRFKDRHEANANIYVTSNQDEVTLFLNGKEFAKQGGAKRLFHFVVPVEGDFKVEAVAGNCKEEASFHKVAVANPEYVLHVKSNNASWEKKK
ncbi:MAG: glycoside hydrolase family 2 TIM barrel-domain containing protein [Bacilli bacterium]|nr:glycoside hydrolase family 2 TIM barrel-domain containing protein [Bacilli bacterium]